MLPLGYLINASLFAALGAVYETAQDAQVGVAVTTAPMFATVLIAQSATDAPDSALVAFSSLFPLTAPVMLPTRMLLADVPPWELAASASVCATTAAALIWVAGRLFRASLLTHGRGLRLRDVWLAFRTD